MYLSVEKTLTPEGTLGRRLKGGDFYRLGLLAVFTDSIYH